MRNSTLCYDLLAISLWHVHFVVIFKFSNISVSSLFYFVAIIYYMSFASWTVNPEVREFKIKFDSWCYFYDFSCFERFFRHVNTKEGKLSMKRRGGYVMDDLNLIGVEYLWRVWQSCDMKTFSSAYIDLLQRLF